ncbi:hypothetical protein [Brevibacterium sp. JSBI002]|uniref:hypothetical protein n=1 Tax=Brevibacterium sp. JSBI002 TaxID=2886045 RepID=UPI00222F22A5|nr:hypothetical protein [Brevibacterium sp. JSBI002]UZD63660.1 hypothetical protein LJ362_07495 [Brevibacterium sp. JSBI002]
MTDEASSEAEANVARLHEILDLRRLEFTAASSETDFFIGHSQYKPDGRSSAGRCSHSVSSQPLPHFPVTA